jgi:hypothetical protein
VTAFVVHELGGDGYAIASQTSVESAMETAGGYALLGSIFTWGDVRSNFDDLPAWMADEIIGSYGDAEDWPEDSEEFDSPIVVPDDPESDVDLRVRAAMLEELPEDLVDGFDLVVDTTLDGDLGFVDPDQLDAVVAALEAAGHTVTYA